MPPAPLSSSEKSAPERINAPFPAHPKRERGRFYVRQTGAGPVWGLAVLFCGGGLPPVLALLRHGLRARAAAQSVVTLHLPARRGNFYDHRGQLLTGQTTRWMALCVPGEGSYARLFAYTDAAGQAALYQKRNAASPFLLEVDRDVSALGVSCWPAARRSSAAPLAVQLLGYLDGEGHGAAGLEAAFDDLLTGSGAGDTLLCTVNAQGKLRAEPVLTPADSGAVGVQLTLSR